jgi:ribosomal protein S18 acetylase RimI-like enzyme
LTVRSATPADAAEIAGIHVDTWRAAYGGIVPQDYLASLSYEESEEMWRRTTSEGGGNAGCVFVAEEGGTPFGFSSGRPRTRFSQGLAEFKGVLDTLYVLPSRQRAGAGRQLVSAVAGHLTECGVSSMVLWVLEENKIARRFYESLGGTLIGEDSLELGGAELSEVAYGWKDLDVLRLNPTAD